MEWLESNLAVLSGVAVPLLLGVIKPLMERESGGREFRRIRRHAYLRALLPNESEAASKLDHLLAMEIEFFTKRISSRLERKIDVGNLVTIIIVSLVGGGVSFGLVTWAQAVSGAWASLLWVAFIAWTLFVLLLVFVGGFSRFYRAGD